MRVSRLDMSVTRSESPVATLVEEDQSGERASRSKNRATRGSSQKTSMFEIQPVRHEVTRPFAHHLVAM